MRAAGAGERCVANCQHSIYGAARGDWVTWMGSLFCALARVVERHMCDFNAQSLANTAWAFVTAGQFDLQMFTAIARVAEQRVCDFKVHELANIAWAFAVAEQSDVQPFKASARVAERRVGDFNVEYLASAAWAFATAGQLDAQLFTALARTAERTVCDFKPEELANIAWAFVNVGQSNAQLFTALSRTAERHVGDFKTQGVASKAWVSASACQLLGKDLAFTPATELFYGKKGPPGQSELDERVLNYEKELEETILRRGLVQRVDDPEFKRLWALQDWTGKAKQQQFLIDGSRQIKAALDAGSPLVEIWVDERSAWNLAWWEERTSSAGLHVNIFTQKLLKKLHLTQQPDALAVANFPSLPPRSLAMGRMLILDEIHESFHLGTILRSAEAFGIMEVLCVMQNATARLFSRETIRSSIGSIFHLNLSVMKSFAEAILYCGSHGVRVIATTSYCDEDLATANFSDFSSPCAVAVGDELSRMPTRACGLRCLGQWNLSMSRWQLGLRCMLWL